MKPKISFRAWARTMLFSVTAAFVLQGIFNFDDLRNAFEKAGRKGSHLYDAQTSMPDYLRVPEMIAGLIGRVWHWR